MKKANLFKSILSMLLAGILCCSFAACGNTTDPTGDDPEPEVPAVTISIGAGVPNEIKKGEQVTLTVTITNTTNKKYAWSVTDSEGKASDILAVSDEDVVTVAKDVELDTSVTVTATADADKTKTASHTFTVKPNLTGEVGSLTAAALEAVAGPNLTVSGTVTDVYEDLNYSANSYETAYHSVVMMDTGKWYGAFNPIGDENEENVIASNYRMGEQFGTQGHALTSVFINKDNEVEERPETNYMSVPFSWESQHLWNHIDNLGNISEKFTYDATEDEYIYNIVTSGPYDTDASKDEYLMAYFAVSFTAMVEDNFTAFRLKMTGDKVTGIWAQTAVKEWFAGDGETVVSRAYTEVELTISDVGETVVPDPKPYDAPEGAKYLEQVIDTMKAARNYTFTAVDTAVSAPDYDAGDYEMESFTGGASTIAKAVPVATGDQYYFKHAASRGTVGTKGYVTENAAIFETVGMYSASMDGNDYNFNYSGYRQYGSGDGAYFEVIDDEQVYTTVKGLIGVERRQGNFFEKAMPQWSFSPNIFESFGPTIVRVGNKNYNAYIFTLRDSLITNDVSRQIAADNMAANGDAAAFATLTITVAVDENDNATILQTKYPYAYLGGDYSGIITTTYSDFGNTKLLANAFDEAYYTQRVWRDTWDKYTAHDFDPSHTSERTDEVASTVLAHMFPNANINADMPKPEVIMNLISDDINGPWFDYSTLADETVRENFSFNCAMNNDDSRLDRNGRPIDIESILGPSGTLLTELKKVNSAWTYDNANSGLRTPSNPESSYFATYLNTSAGVMMVVESNNTKNFFFDLYKIGEWHLSRD